MNTKVYDIKESILLEIYAAARQGTEVGCRYWIDRRMRRRGNVNEGGNEDG